MAAASVATSGFTTAAEPAGGDPARLTTELDLDLPTDGSSANRTLRSAGEGGAEEEPSPDTTGAEAARARARAGLEDAAGC